MRAKEFMFEGGWASKATQGTVITPNTVKSALNVISTFVTEFNTWLSVKNLPGIEMGRPTGSTAYHGVDSEDKIYGDIDLQMIAPELEENLSSSQFSKQWNTLVDEFLAQKKPAYVNREESTSGHPIIAIGNDKFVQIDFMWHPPKLAKWGAARATPERGIKGLLTGNMFSVLGELLNMSIQHAGVQLRVSNGERVPFSKRKNTETVTITTDPDTFILDTFYWLANQQKIKDPKLDTRLEANPGIDLDNVKISSLVQAIQGFAHSLALNKMYGKGDLANIDSEGSFIADFIVRYKNKALADINNVKRNKADSPEAVARAEQDRKKVRDGLDLVLKMFGVTSTNPVNEMALPSNWDEKELGHDKSFASRLRYVRQKAKSLGTGSARVAFIIPDNGRDTVVKIAKNRKGLAQNEVEADSLYDNYVKNLEIAIPIIDVDRKNPQPVWIQTEKAEKISHANLCKIMKTNDIVTVADYARYMLGEVDWNSRIANDYYQRLSESDKEIFVYYAQKLAELSSATDVLLSDFGSASNWGLFKGKPVLIDVGFDEKVRELYI